MHQPARLTRPQVELTRRTMIAGLASVGGLVLAGCGGAQTSSETDNAQSSAPAPSAPTPTPTPTPQLASMTVYRDPSCGCCEAWAGLARDAGYQVQLIDHPNMTAIKRQYGVPEELLSCHTAIVGGYAIEGHVPLENVKRLLAERPQLKGIAVAGMPLGSPGMEVPDGTKEPFQVMAFDAAGRITPTPADRARFN